MFKKKLKSFGLEKKDEEPNFIASLSQTQTCRVIQHRGMIERDVGDDT
jgi:hypothetical protein